MPGGSCCAIFGCPAQKATNRGLTFHKLPKKGKNDDWRDALIRKINRIDHLFNPDKATICSRHFLSSCFKYGPSGVRFLIPGSLPTEYMPCKSVETPKPPPRRPPPIRPPPAVPERVAYYSFTEVQKDAQSLPAAWCLLSSQANQITVGIVDLVLDVVTMKVTVSDNFTVSLFIKGKKVPNVTTVSLERQKLRDYLNQVAVAKTCDGITDASLQRYADVLENPSKQVYYREVTRDGSVIRAVDCSLLIQGAPSDLQLCRACKQAKRSVLKKKARAVSISVPVGKHAPLKVLSKEKLLRALKTLRKENKILEGKLKHFMTKLPNESVEVVSPLHGVSSPLREISSHVREGSSPLYEVCSLLQEGSNPVLRVSPVHEFNGPLQEGSSPVLKVSPVHEGSSPLQEGSSPLHEGSSPLNEGSSPLNEGSSPLNEGSSPLNEGSSPVIKVSPVHEGSGPLHEGSSPLNEGSSPVIKVSPVHEGSSPLNEGNLKREGVSCRQGHQQTKHRTRHDAFRPLGSSSGIK